MKWILKLIIAGLAAGVLVYLFHLYPFAWSLLLHRPPGWLSTLLTDYIQAIETPAGRPDPFLVVIFSLALLLLVSLHLKLLSRTTNYGSAGFMGWLEAGRFAAPIFSGLLGLLLWVLRVPFFLVVVTLKGVGVLGHGIQYTSRMCRLARLLRPHALSSGPSRGAPFF